MNDLKMWRFTGAIGLAGVVLWLSQYPLYMVGHRRAPSTLTRLSGDVLRALILLPERYGRVIPVGLRISISYRDLAVAAGVGFGIVIRVVRHLKVGGWLQGNTVDRVSTRSVRADSHRRLPNQCDTCGARAFTLKGCEGGSFKLSNGTVLARGSHPRRALVEARRGVWTPPERPKRVKLLHALRLTCVDPTTMKCSGLGS
jgi:hypothetical protein